MEILVTGANGFLGQHLCRYLKERHSVHATGKGEKRLPFDDVKYFSCDLVNAAKVEQIVQNLRPDAIIHTAAMSKPDACLQEPELCRAVNIQAIRSIIDAVKQVNKDIHLVYTSSDFVLGDDGPHDENAIPAPLNFYGETKLEGEKVLANSGLQYTIVRPVFMYGETWSGMRPTFLHWVKESLEAGKQIKVVSDQQRTPSYVGDICKGIEAIIARKAKGLFHLAGAEIVSPYEMAVQFAELLQLDAGLIEAVTAATFPEPVDRAKNGGLKIDKAIRELDYKPISLQEGLQAVSMLM
jgi:dTDP-4-dehydrorhamnose reductase